MMSAGEGGIFVMSSGAKDNVILRIDPATNSVSATVSAPPGASAICARRGCTVGLQRDTRAVSKLDPKTGATISTIETTARNGFLTIGAGSVWARNDYPSVISRIEPTPTR